MQTQKEMTKKEISRIKEQLDSPKKIIITTHQLPDGDAMGSSLAFYHYLLQKGHKATVISPSNYPNFLKWLPGNDHVLNYYLDKDLIIKRFDEADMMFCLDYNTPDRAKGLKELVTSFDGIKIVIDHHPDPDDFGDYMLSVVSSSSTAELIFEFITSLGDRGLINKDVAACIYTGILTDTGSFSYGSTSANAHYIAGEMIKAGADNLMIQDHIFQSNTEDRIRLLGYAISEKLKVVKDLNVAYIMLSIEDLEKFNFQQGDTEGLVNHALSINKVSLAVLMTEKTECVKFSFRSSGKCPANLIAKEHFNGGGHRNAAGGERSGTLQDAETQFLAIILNYKDKLT